MSHEQSLAPTVEEVHMRRLLILGAGTAGTMIANKLHRRLSADEWAITVGHAPHAAVAYGTDRRARRPRRPPQRSHQHLVEGGAKRLVNCPHVCHSLRSTALTTPRIFTCSGYIGSISSFSGCSRTRPDSR